MIVDIEDDKEVATTTVVGREVVSVAGVDQVVEEAAEVLDREGMPRKGQLYSGMIHNKTQSSILTARHSVLSRLWSRPRRKLRNWKMLYSRARKTDR